MNPLMYLLALLESDFVLYLILLLGAALGAIVGLLLSYLWWDRTCKAYEDDAEMHIDIAMSAIREKNHALRLNAHLEEENRHLKSMLSGEEVPTDGLGMIIPCSNDEDDFSHLPRDIQFPQ